MRAQQAYRYALAPNNAQRSALASHAGAARFAFNWGLALVKARLDARMADRAVVVPSHLARCHRRVRNVRRDAMAKLTATLARTHAVVVVESLSVAGMTRRAQGQRRSAKAGLNRAALDAALAQLRRQLTYKCPWQGGRLVVADRWYPSSKICCGCGWRTPSLPLSARIFECERCGLVIDRDHNAARNLAKVAVAASAAETRNGRGGAVRPPPERSGEGSSAEASTGQPALAGISPGALGPIRGPRSDR
jgi:IS605 OrfB family transposase